MWDRKYHIQAITLIEKFHSRVAHVTIIQDPIINVRPYNVFVRAYPVTAPTLGRIQRLVESKNYSVMQTEGYHDKTVKITHLQVVAKGS